MTSKCLKLTAMKTIHIAFLLFPKVHLQDLAGPAQVFYEASEPGTVQFKISYVSTDPEVMSAQGLPLAPLNPPESIVLHRGDLVCIPGFSFADFLEGELDARIDQVKDWILEQHRKGVFIASICSGALALARLGLLNHTAYTSHWKCLPYMKAQFPKIQQLKNRLYVLDQGIFTSAGMTSGIDMCLALIEQWCSPLLAAKVAREMVINIRRAETQDQENVFLDFKNHFNADVYKAQVILASNLRADFTVSELGGALHMTVRHLSRLFKQHTGQTIQAYREKIRIEHGEQLLLNSEMTVKEIAAKCGFGSPRQFSRLWQSTKGMSPGAYRKMTKSKTAGQLLKGGQ